MVKPGDWAWSRRGGIRMTLEQGCRFSVCNFQFLLSRFWVASTPRFGAIMSKTMQDGTFRLRTLEGQFP
jgi:hypothetical protein